MKRTDVRKVKLNGESELIEREVFLTEDKKEVVKLNDTYYYLSKDGLRILKKHFKA